MLNKQTAKQVCALLLGACSWATMHNANAQPASASPTQTEALSTRLVLLGTAAGPIPRKERSQPANLLLVGGRPYLIDAGNGVVRQLAYAGYHPSDVRTVFITHHHVDHNADVGALIAFSWLEDFKRGNYKTVGPVRFYGPPATPDLVQAAFNYFAVSERIFRAGSAAPMAAVAERFEGYEYAGEGVVFRDDRIKVTAVENSHYRTASGESSPTRDKSYALRFDTPGRSIVFCGDTGPSDAVTQLAQGADVLVCGANDLEASLKYLTAGRPMPPLVLTAMRAHMERQHITLEQVGVMAQKAGVKTVVLTHFAPGADGEPDDDRYASVVRQHFGGRVIAGRDLLSIE